MKLPMGAFLLPKNSTKWAQPGKDNKMELKTKNSVYHINLAAKTVTGGIFKNTANRYTKVEYHLGYPAVFFMTDGTVVTTSSVTTISVA